MLPATVDELDRLLHEEKQRVAFEFFKDAWDAALEEGIEPAILADSAVEAALTGLDCTDGQTAVSEAIRRLSQRHECGGYITGRRLQ